MRNSVLPSVDFLPPLPNFWYRTFYRTGRSQGVFRRYISTSLSDSEQRGTVYFLLPTYNPSSPLILIRFGTVRNNVLPSPNLQSLITSHPYPTRNNEEQSTSFSQPLSLPHQLRVPQALSDWKVEGCGGDEVWDWDCGVRIELVFYYYTYVRVFS